jgi:hypothetical protein
MVLTQTVHGAPCLVCFEVFKIFVKTSSTISSGDFLVNDVWYELPTANGNPFVASLNVTVSSKRYNVAVHPDIGPQLTMHTAGLN